MTDLRYTLLADGSSDRALLPLLTWLLRQHLDSNCAIQPAWADLSRLPRPRPGLNGRIQDALYLYPCDLLFVHRDAEHKPRDNRIEEIRAASANLDLEGTTIVCVVPVRMQEAWLLFDLPALRQAAANPNGHNQLTLPPLCSLEDLSDPKDKLHQLLRDASGLKGRRCAKFSPHRSAQRVTEFIEDFSPLRQLSSFRALEEEIAHAIKQCGWSS